MYKALLISLLWITVLTSSLYPCVGQSLNLTFTTAFVIFPSDTNANPPMTFGGKLLSEMDRTAAITVRRFLYYSPTVHDAVTVGINKVTFHKAAEVKDLLFVTGTVVKVGKKSVTVDVKIEKELQTGTRELIVSGEFTFCSYNLKTKKSDEHLLHLGK